MSTITWKQALCEKPTKNLIFTAKQRILIRDIVDQNKDVTDNMPLFRKLLANDYIVEYKVVGGYQYLLSEHAEKIFETLPKNKTGNNNKCFNCNGSGYIPHYAHVQNGVCFSCNGSGKK